MTPKIVSIARTKGSFSRRDPERSEPLCGFECDPSSIHCAIWSRPEFVGSAVLQICSEYLESNDEEKIRLGVQGVRELCTSFNETTRAKLESQEHQQALEEQIELVKAKTDLANRLLIDQNTGLLTGAGLHELESRLYNGSGLEVLKSKKNRIRLLIADINDLKEHNRITEDQGDAAIAAVGAKLRRLYARDADFVGVEHLHEESDLSIEKIADEGITARSHGRGDEFVVYTFISPDDVVRSRATIYRELERLHQELHAVTYHFEGETYRVGVAFALAEFTIPGTLEELHEKKQIIDEFMRNLKAVRKVPGGSITFGDVVTIEP